MSKKSSLRGGPERGPMGGPAPMNVIDCASLPIIKSNGDQTDEHEHHQSVRSPPTQSDLKQRTLTSHTLTIFCTPKFYILVIPRPEVCRFCNVILSRGLYDKYALEGDNLGIFPYCRIRPPHWSHFLKARGCRVASTERLYKILMTH